jgi:hypothetical protein
MKMIHLSQPKNKFMFFGALLMILLGLVFLGIGIYQVHSSRADETSVRPNFKPVLPEGKTIESLGGWEKLTSPNGDAFYIFVDTVDGVTVNVSQQQLPGKFKGDVMNKMTDLARAYNANTKLDADGVRVYVGTSAKGPQSVLFTKNDLLILIKSWATIPDSEWITYVKSLQ